MPHGGDPCLDLELQVELEGHGGHTHVVDEQLDIAVVGGADAEGGQLDPLRGAGLAAVHSAAAT
jgi:hypothetical protein